MTKVIWDGIGRKMQILTVIMLIELKLSEYLKVNLTQEVKLIHLQCQSAVLRILLISASLTILMDEVLQDIVLVINIHKITLQIANLN